MPAMIGMSCDFFFFLVRPVALELVLRATKHCNIEIRGARGRFVSKVAIFFPVPVLRQRSNNNEIRGAGGRLE